MFELIRKGIKEALLTLSNKTSFLSSKRIERAVFTGSSVIIVLGTWIHLMVVDRITASESVILVTPLLISGGYNLSMGQKEANKNETTPNNSPS